MFYPKSKSSVGISFGPPTVLFSFWFPKYGISPGVVLFVSLFLYQSVNDQWGGASENNINHVRVAVNKILRIILHVKQHDHNIPETGTHELYSTLFVL